MISEAFLSLLRMPRNTKQAGGGRNTKQVGTATPSWLAAQPRRREVLMWWTLSASGSE